MHIIVRFSDLESQEVKDQRGKFNSSIYTIIGFLQIHVNHFYYEPKLMYVRTTTLMAKVLWTPIYNFVEYDLVFHWLELPLLLGYKTGYKIVVKWFHAGPVLDYMMSIEAETRLARISDWGGDI